MKASSIKHQASSIKQARPRPLASVIQFNLVAAAFLLTATEVALSQSCTGGTCPQVIVTGVRFSSGGGFGGSGYTTFDASQQVFEYYGDIGEEVAAPSIGTPETCAAFQAELDARSCSQHQFQQPNGCGAAGGWLTSILNIVIPDDYLGGGGVNFNRSCGNHDKCYGSAGFNRYQCDEEFGSDLTKECNFGKTSWRADAIDFGYSGTQLTNYVTEQLYQCTSQGTIMRGAVGQFGAPAFEAGQQVAACVELKAEAQRLGCAVN